MSLSIEWFAASDQRNKMRDANGVSIEEAEGDLAFNSSSAYPVAEETARWIYKNWSLEKIFQLSPSARQTLLRIIEDQLKKFNTKTNLISTRDPIAKLNVIKNNYHPPSCLEPPF